MEVEIDPRDGWVRVYNTVNHPFKAYVCQWNKVHPNFFQLTLLINKKVKQIPNAIRLHIYQAIFQDWSLKMRWLKWTDVIKFTSKCVIIHHIYQKHPKNMEKSASPANQIYLLKLDVRYFWLIIFRIFLSRGRPNWFYTALPPTRIRSHHGIYIRR